MIISFSTTLVGKCQTIRDGFWLFPNRQTLLLLSLGFLALLSGCDNGPEIIEISGKKFGTSYRLTVIADQPAPIDLVDQIESELDKIDSSMSTYKTDSEINLFNSLGANISFDVSKHFASVVKISKNVWQGSGGAFDPTIGPLVDLWGFGPDVKNDQIPHESDVALAMEFVGLDAISLDESIVGTTISKSRAVRLDLSAVAKGYAVDVLANLLESSALTDYLIEIGGETRVGGYNAQGQPWRLAIEKPGDLGGIAYIVSMVDGAIATSGDYRNYFELDGRRYSHTIDPGTGHPVIHNLASVSVIADTCAEADAWATAMMVLGDKSGLALANALDLPVFMVVKDGQAFQFINSAAFEIYKDEKFKAQYLKEI